MGLYPFLMMYIQQNIQYSTSAVHVVYIERMSLCFLQFHIWFLAHKFRKTRKTIFKSYTIGCNSLTPVHSPHGDMFMYQMKCM